MGSKCCCAGCTCPTTICVTSCSNTLGGVGLSGAVVTVGTLPSQTVDSTGCATFCLDSIGGPGNYTVTVVAGSTTCFSGTKALTCHGTTNITADPTCLCDPGATTFHGSWTFTFNGGAPTHCAFVITAGAGTCFAIASFQFNLTSGFCFVNVNGCGSFPLKNTSTCSPFNLVYDVVITGCGAFPGDTIVGTLTVTP